MNKQSYQRTKIIATIGPSSSSYQMLEKLIMGGVDVCRLNMSHGTVKDHIKVIESIREINRKNSVYAGILVDLQGPKIRIGEIEDGGVEVTAGNDVIITTEEVVGNSKKVSISYKNFPIDTKKGDLVLINDGKIQLEVKEILSSTEVKTHVIFGGPISSKKGVNLPNTSISLPGLTEKDKNILKQILQYRIQWIALSFVRSSTDIIDLKHIIKNTIKHNQPRIIAKIEKPEAVEDIDDIIKETDAVMVARGDLGVEVPLQQVPLIQKNIIKKCLKSSKPVIIATQMMESMIYNATPTRAEVSDVANSVMDGADALMLSGETSVGKFPLRVIETMQKIIERMEEYEGIYNKMNTPVKDNNERFISDSICYNACSIAKHSSAKAILTMTHSGYTAFKVSSNRPKANIFVFTDNKPLLETLSLIWGIRGYYYDKYISTDHTIEDIKHILRKDGKVIPGNLVVNIASIPINEKGNSNMVKLSEV